MNNEKDYLIPFVGLKLGKHNYNFHIEKDFIKSFGYDDFEDINVNVDLVFDKKPTILELDFSFKGAVTVICDLTGEVFDLPISGELKLIVKFGDEFNNENEELLILPFSEYQVNIMQYIYEMIVLSIPMKRVHPDQQQNVELDDDFDMDELDFLNDDELDFLDSIHDSDDDQISITSDEEEIDEDKKIDPRWEKLKQLLTDK